MKDFFIDKTRRSLLGKLFFSGSVLALASTSPVAQEEKTTTATSDDRFPGDDPEHRIVYQFNKADEEYHQHVLFSVGAMLRKYGDNIKIVVTCFGPGLHILAKKPTRSVSIEIKERVSSLAIYGVEFHACGNTMKSLNWTEKDLYDFVQVVEVGASDLLELQEQGYSYISW